MKLDFVGTGSAFHTELGNNNSILSFDDKQLFIDCGEVNFHRLKVKGLLKDVTDLHILISHAHPDHMGSLGTLLFFMYYHQKPIVTKKATVYIPSKIRNQVVSNILNSGGELEQFDIVEIGEKHNILGLEVECYQTDHVKPIDSFSFVFSHGEESIYYSADANDIADDIVNRFAEGSIQHIYQDTCMLDYPNNPHMSLPLLEKTIPITERNRVTCMHLDITFDTALAEKMGFRIAKEMKS